MSCYRIILWDEAFFFWHGCNLALVIHWEVVTAATTTLVVVLGLSSSLTEVVVVSMIAFVVATSLAAFILVSVLITSFPLIKFFNISVCRLHICAMCNVFSFTQFEVTKLLEKVHADWSVASYLLILREWLEQRFDLDDVVRALTSLAEFFRNFVSCWSWSSNCFYRSGFGWNYRLNWHRTFDTKSRWSEWSALWNEHSGTDFEFRRYSCLSLWHCDWSLWELNILDLVLGHLISGRNIFIRHPFIPLVFLLILSGVGVFVLFEVWLIIRSWLLVVAWSIVLHWIVGLGSWLLGLWLLEAVVISLVVVEPLVLSRWLLVSVWLLLLVNILILVLTLWCGQLGVVWVVAAAVRLLGHTLVCIVVVLLRRWSVRWDEAQTRWHKWTRAGAKSGSNLSECSSIGAEYTCFCVQSSWIGVIVYGFGVESWSCSGWCRSSHSCGWVQCLGTWMEGWGCSFEPIKML